MARRLALVLALLPLTGCFDRTPQTIGVSASVGGWDIRLDRTERHAEGGGHAITGVSLDAWIHARNVTATERPRFTLIATSPSGTSARILPWDPWVRGNFGPRGPLPDLPPPWVGLENRSVPEGEVVMTHMKFHLTPGTDGEYLPLALEVRARGDNVTLPIVLKRPPDPPILPPTVSTRPLGSTVDHRSISATLVNVSYAGGRCGICVAWNATMTTEGGPWNGTVEVRLRLGDGGWGVGRKGLNLTGGPQTWDVSGRVVTFPDDPSVFSNAVAYLAFDDDPVPVVPPYAVASPTARDID